MNSALPKSAADARAVGAAVLIALALRLVQAALRWDELALAYVAYAQPWLDRAAVGEWAAALGTFTGLHPPLHSLILGVLNVIWGAPAAWILWSALASTGAVWLLGRAEGAGAAFVLALDPLQLQYAAEVNNYPTLCLLAAAAWAARQRAMSGGGGAWLGIIGGLGGLCHLLGGVWAGLCALSVLGRDRRAAATALGLMAIIDAAVIVRAAQLSGGEGTFGQAGLALEPIVEGLGGKLGPVLWLWPVALVFVARRPGLSAVGLGYSLIVLGWMALGVAAPHQQPYWLLTSVAVAGLWGAAPRLMLAVALMVSMAQLRPLFEDASGLWQRLGWDRGVDQALLGSRPGDALWLLAPGLAPDDDKRQSSDVLWRFDPFAPAPPWRGDGDQPSFEYTDYGFGQPRWLGGRVVHTSTDLWPAQLDAALGWHLDAGRRVWFVLYDHSPAYDYEGKLTRALRPYAHRCVSVGDDHGLGQDLLCVVEGRL